MHTLPYRQRMLTFAGVILAMFMASLDQTVISTAMPRIIADLGGFSRYTWVSSAYIIASAVIMPVTGRLSDLYGRKRFYLLGMMIFLLSSIACGVSQNMAQMIAARAVKGLGAGIMMATGFTVIADLFPPAQRGKYVGYGSAVFAVSSIIGPTLGGYITDMFSWQWVFYINIPFSVTVMVLFALFFPSTSPLAGDKKIDYPGVLLLILTLVPFMTALASGKAGGPWAPMVGNNAVFIFSGLMLGLFIWNERRVKNPILPMTLFNNPIVSVSFAVTFLTGFSMYGTIVFIPLYFQGVLGATATVSGSFLTPMMLGLVVGSFGSGQVLARTGGHYRTQGIVGILVLCAGLFLLTRMGTQTGFSTAVFNISLTGLGLGIAIPLHTIAVQNSVPYQLLGVATSTTAFFRSLGGAVGLAALGARMNHAFFDTWAKELSRVWPDTVFPDRLNDLPVSPRVLVDPGRQAELQAFLSGLPGQSTDLFQSVMSILKQSLQSSLGQVFFISLGAAGTALFFSFFLKEIPLRKQHGPRGAQRP